MSELKSNGQSKRKILADTLIKKDDEISRKQKELNSLRQEREKIDQQLIDACVNEDQGDLFDDDGDDTSSGVKKEKAVEAQHQVIGESRQLGGGAFRLPENTAVVKFKCQICEEEYEASPDNESVVAGYIYHKKELTGVYKKKLPKDVKQVCGGCCLKVLNN